MASAENPQTPDMMVASHQEKLNLGIWHYYQKFTTYYRQ
jgi:hypothetical protein